MAKVNVSHNSDFGYLGSADAHAEEWRIHGNEAQMVDASGHGALSPAEDDAGFGTCMNPTRQPDGSIVCETGRLSGASDGARASRRSAERLDWHARHAGSDIEDPDGIGRRIV